ncbi:ACP phosphodiesterase [Reinekea sp.]|jgi:acyl carrier protein phosphodiesterase|uniref:acyl carrier protein phosphodiesterase n=1 Tax=Reinekea sp. TaxID=1970455 RepID=UPI0039898904
MNFLGHCLFSDQTPEALAGSLWPDFGLRPNNNASKVFLAHFDRHQAIDKFTDQCDELEPMRLKLRPVFRKTSPLVIDVLIDHYLAKHWSSHHPVPLEQFASQCYQHLDQFNEFPMSKRFEQTLFWMTKQDWFNAYAQPEGIEQALTGMSRRIRFETPLATHAHQACSLVAGYDECFSDYLNSLTQHLNKQD